MLATIDIPTIETFRRHWQAPRRSTRELVGVVAGAHCTAPTRTAGFDEEPEPFVLRNHHKILTYGRHLHTVRAWARLSGTTVEHITGGEIS